MYASRIAFPVDEQTDQQKNLPVAGGTCYGNPIPSAPSPGPGAWGDFVTVVFRPPTLFCLHDTPELFAKVLFGKVLRFISWSKVLTKFLCLSELSVTLSCTQNMPMTSGNGTSGSWQDRLVFEPP
jgi:hypothetical protein